VRKILSCSELSDQPGTAFSIQLHSHPVNEVKLAVAYLSNGCSLYSDANSNKYFSVCSNLSVPITSAQSHKNHEVKRLPRICIMLQADIYCFHPACAKRSAVITNFFIYDSMKNRTHSRCSFFYADTGRSSASSLGAPRAANLHSHTEIALRTPPTARSVPSIAVQIPVLAKFQTHIFLLC
jgi:hypothetical protein